MMRFLMFAPLCLTLVACAPKPPNDAVLADQAASADAVEENAEAETGALTSAPPPPPEARTAEALDTTSIEQRAEAAASPAETTTPLGKTVVSLGSPTEPGFWLKTPLVQLESPGRVTNPANGKSSAVRLIPIEGPATAGSRMSLAAMRLIELPLTELGEVEVSLGSGGTEIASD